MVKQGFKKEWLDVPVLDDCQSYVMSWVREHRRTPSRQELRWLLMRYEMKRIAAESRPPIVAMAAATGGINETISRNTSQTRIVEFKTNDGRYRVRVTITPIEGKDPAVRINMTDDNRNPISNGKIIFPGINVDVVTDEDGLAKIGYSDYAAYLEKVMGIECSIPGGAVQPLVVESYE